MLNSRKHTVPVEQHAQHPIANKSSKLFLLLRTLPCLVLIFLPVCSAQEQQAMIYLSQYGYLPPKASNPSSGALLSGDTFAQAISEFQSFAGLNVTGHLDNETIRLMNTPRCGVKDKVGFGSHERSKRYALQGSRWRVKALTYKISKYPRLLKQEVVDREVEKAFGVWSKHTDLTFTQKKFGSVHIEIRFEKGEHGDGDPFDGPGGTLAHAYFPVYGGDAHFDDDEVWTVDTHRGTNLFQVAAHEFGHSLGLSHSDIRSALMAPFYRGYQPYFELDEDDIEGIQALYGRKSSSLGTTPHHTDRRKSTTEPTNSIDEDNQELCKDGKMDTVFSVADSVYVFKGDHYWRLEDEGVAPGYPKLISKGWPGLTGNIDAAFTYKNGKTYFFKGGQYWRYVGKKLDGAYPKPISSGFAGIPDDLDAALVWTGNGKIYFFKDDKFWKFDPAQKPPVKNNYPKPISNWEGVPNNIDAALQYNNGYTYFFKKGAYWRFNDRSFSVDTANPAFPRSAAFWWYGCKEATKGTLGNLKDGKDFHDDDDDRRTRTRVSSEYHDDLGLNVDDLILDAVPDSQVPFEKENRGNNSVRLALSTTSIMTSIILLLFNL